MCTTLISYNLNSDYPIVIASNRDEFYDRPTLNAHFWDEYPNVIGGIDEKYLGTWLGITLEGKIGILTNYRDPANYRKNLKSRGILLKNFLTTNISIDSFSKTLMNEKNAYNGYNIIFGDVNKLVYYSNIENKIKMLSSGIYGLSNAFLNTPWPKVEKGKELLGSELKKIKPNQDNIMNILKNDDFPSDDELPDTGIGLEYERLLSSIFVRSSKYGTRSSIVIMIDKQFNVNFVEDVYEPKKNKFNKKKNNFSINI